MFMIIAPCSVVFMMSFLGLIVSMGVEDDEW
jgi:hypothetical protein